MPDAPAAQNVQGGLHVPGFLSRRKKPVPYTNNSGLPEPVRNALPPAAQSRFRAVANDAYSRGLDDKAAHSEAWSVVGNGWKKSTSGKWVRKLAPEPRTLFASRPLLNADDVIKWAKEQGFPTTQLPSDMHVTLAYSKEALPWPQSFDNQVIIPPDTNRSVEALGDGGAVVLRFDDPLLQKRWEDLVDEGATWDFESFKPHITITWHGQDVDLEKVAPYNGMLVFGPEAFQEVNTDWAANHVEKNDMTIEKIGRRHSSADLELLQHIHDQCVELGAGCSGHESEEEGSTVNDTAATHTNIRGELQKIVKVDDTLGLVFGHAIICKVGGEDYYDVQGDHVPEHAMLKAAMDFMLSDRVAKEMHYGSDKGTIVFAFPLTAEIAKAYGIEAGQTSLMIGMKPDNPATLAKFKAGPAGEPPMFTGFSIGGYKFDPEEMAA